MRLTSLLTSICFNAIGASIAQPALSALKPTKSFTFVNPCNRGPMPLVRVINAPIYRFVQELQQVFPNIPEGDAYVIGFKLCEDVSIYGNDPALTARLDQILQEYAAEKGLAVGASALRIEQSTSKQKSAAAQAAIKAAPTTGGNLQMGLFADESNADKTITALLNAGLEARKAPASLGGKSVWRVYAPNMTSQEIISQARDVASSLGIKDAYLTAN